MTCLFVFMCGSASDMVVVNFGLHYVQQEWEREYRPEMTAMLRELMVSRPTMRDNEKLLIVTHRLIWALPRTSRVRCMTWPFDAVQTFASTPGKVLVWRENSAQHHLSDGGEWPPFIGGTGLREETFNAFKDRCHTLRFRHESWPMYRDKVVLRVASVSPVLEPRGLWLERSPTRNSQAHLYAVLCGDCSILSHQILGYTVQALGVSVDDCEGSDWKVSDDGKRCLKMPNATTSPEIRLVSAHTGHKYPDHIGSMTIILTRR